VQSARGVRTQNRALAHAFATQEAALSEVALDSATAGIGVAVADSFGPGPAM
jgi:hypothetical protein